MKTKQDMEQERLSHQIAEDVLHVLNMDGYRNDVAVTYKNLLGHSNWEEVLTVNTPYGFFSDIHFYKKTRLWKRYRLQWAQAYVHKGYTVLSLEGTAYLMKNKRLVKKF